MPRCLRMLQNCKLADKIPTIVAKSYNRPHIFLPLNVVVVRCDRCCRSSSCTSSCRCFSSCYWSSSCRCSTTCKFPDVLRRSRSSTPPTASTPSCPCCAAGRSSSRCSTCSFRPLCVLVPPAATRSCSSRALVITPRRQRAPQYSRSSRGSSSCCSCCSRCSG